MGYSATGRVVFGLKVSRSQTMIQETSRGCNHALSEGQNFCPKCGKPAYVTEEVEAFQTSNKDGLYFYSPTYETSQGVLGFSLVPLYGDEEDIYVIEKTMPKMVRVIQEFCETHGIAFSEEKLKTYSFTYHSY